MAPRAARVSLRLPLVAAILALLVGAQGQADGEQSSASTSAVSSARPSPAQPLQEVTVTAQRAKLAQRVMAFVSKVTGPLFDGGFTRWGKPVCPLASGLRQEAVKFILGRVGDVARATGVPIAAETKCHPNLYILVSSQPQRLLRAMDSHHRWFTFGDDASPGVTDEFISKTAPVRIVYRDAPSVPIPSYPYVSSARVGPVTMAGDSWSFDSHAAKYPIVWYVFRVFVMVDASRLKGLTLRHFADYVSMVGLAQVKPSDDLADAPTILKLFDGAPQAGPAGMSDWDRAFLKSLYATDARSHAQRWSAIVWGNRGFADAALRNCETSHCPREARQFRLSS